MRTVKLFDHRMADGSRNFADLREIAWFDTMRAHLSKLGGSMKTRYVTDSVTEMWLDFEFGGHRFSINNQYGWYWLFVENPKCPDAILSAVAEHFALINQE